MKTYEIEKLLEARKTSGETWLEFLRVPAMSAGVYVLPAGGQDPQRPHSEDELYYVLDGWGLIRIGQEDREIAPGSLVFVEAGVPHHFHSIREELALLVIFAPEEYSRAPAAGRA